MYDQKRRGKVGEEQRYMPYPQTYLNESERAQPIQSTEEDRTI